jgi:hypothetical protein
MLVVMAGLPATGKSTLAARLAPGGRPRTPGATAAAGQALAATPPRWDGPTRLEVRILRREAEEALSEHRP